MRSFHRLKVCQPLTAYLLRYLEAAYRGLAPRRHHCTFSRPWRETGSESPPGQVTKWGGVRSEGPNEAAIARELIVNRYIIQSLCTTVFPSFLWFAPDKRLSYLEPTGTNNPTLSYDIVRKQRSQRYHKASCEKILHLRSTWVCMCWTASESRPPFSRCRTYHSAPRGF
jgi:hypothetical protein